MRMGGRRALIAAVLGLALATTGLAGAVPLADDDLDLPTIIPLAPFNIQTGDADDESGPAMRFSFSTANVGDVPLDIVGAVGTDELTPAHQCVRWAAPRVCLERREVGGIYWHEPHGHFHFSDYALYELRELDAERQPVTDADGLVATSEKISFCLIDSEPYGDPHPLYPTPFYLSCLAGAGFMGLSPGWQDIYPPRRPGQQILLSDIPDGDYALLATLDPENLLFLAEAERTAFTRVAIRGDTVRELRH